MNSSADLVALPIAHRILNHRVDGLGILWYQVQWFYRNDLTWELPSSLHNLELVITSNGLLIRQLMADIAHLRSTADNRNQMISATNERVRLLEEKVDSYHRRCVLKNDIPSTILSTADKSVAVSAAGTSSMVIDYGTEPDMTANDPLSVDNSKVASSTIIKECRVRIIRSVEAERLASQSQLSTNENDNRVISHAKRKSSSRENSDANDSTLEDVVNKGDQLSHGQTIKVPGSALKSTVNKDDKSSEIADKPFPCTKCGKRFSNKSHVKRHEKVHYEPKLRCLHGCGQQFYNEYNRNMHHRRCSHNLIHPDK